MIIISSMQSGKVIFFSPWTRSRCWHDQNLGMLIAHCWLPKTQGKSQQGEDWREWTTYIHVPVHVLALEEKANLTYINFKFDGHTVVRAIRCTHDAKKHTPVACRPELWRWWLQSRRRCSWRSPAHRSSAICRAPAHRSAYCSAAQHSETEWAL